MIYKIARKDIYGVLLVLPETYPTEYAARRVLTRQLNVWTKDRVCVDHTEEKMFDGYTAIKKYERPIKGKSMYYYLLKEDE